MGRSPPKTGSSHRLGEPTGTGLAAMDYLLADPVLVPRSERHLLAEQVIDLPNFLGYRMPDELSAPRDPPALAQGHVTFGWFNRLAKISDRVLALWAAILRAVPGSRLLLKDARAASQLARLRAFFAAQSVDRERLSILGPAPRASHFEAYHDLDIAPDPFPMAAA